MLLINCLEHINIQTLEYKGINVDTTFYKLPIEDDIKPCLYLVTHLPSTEYYAMFAMNLLSKTIFNMVTYLY